VKATFFFCFISFLLFCSCANDAETAQTRPEPQASAPAADLPTPADSPTLTRNLESPIRKIDFRNFTYTGPDDYAETFTLKNGEKPFVWRKEDGISLDDVKYADLTGDGNEEAILKNGHYKWWLVNTRLGLYILDEKWQTTLFMEICYR
jgi:hypothetical protein